MGGYYPHPPPKKSTEKTFLAGDEWIIPPPHKKKTKKNLQKNPLLQGMGGGYLDGVLAGAMRGISNH